MAAMCERNFEGTTLEQMQMHGECWKVLLFTCMRERNLEENCCMRVCRRYDPDTKVKSWNQQHVFKICMPICDRRIVEQSR